MTVSSDNNRISYIGDGTTVLFPFPYDLLDCTDLVVYVAGTLKTLTTDYSVSIALDYHSANVSFVTAPVNGSSVVLLNDPDVLQQTDLPSTGPFPSSSVERALDKLTLIAQRFKDLLSRSVRFSDSDVSGADLTLPAPTPGQLLGWNGSGNGLTNYSGVPSGVLISSAMTPVVQSSTLAYALGLLGGVSGAAMTAALAAAVAPLAPLASPTFIGTPAVPTAPAGTNTTQAASTAMVQSAIASVLKAFVSGLLPTAISGTNTTAAVTVSAGKAADSTNTVFITGTGYAWSVANGNAINGYQGGATLPNNTTIHFYLCSGGSGTGVFAVAQGVGLVAPPGYNSFTRRIFSLVTTAAGALNPVIPQEMGGGGVLMIYNSSPVDYNATGARGAANLSVSVPLGINVLGKFLINLSSSAGTNSRSVSLSYNPNASAVLVVGTAAAYGSSGIEAQVLVIADQQIHNFTVVYSDSMVTVTTLGWIDPRTA